MRYAVFDLGSNSIKFLVADGSGDRFRVQRELSVGTRLAEHLIDTCELRPEAMARTLDALRTLRAEAEKLGAQQFRAVATSAVRDSRNRRVFLKAGAGHPWLPRAADFGAGRSGDDLPRR